MDYKKKLCDAIQNLNLEIDNKQSEKFLRYMDLLLEWNEKINLTAITDKNEIIIKHFADSLSILSIMQIKNQNVIDIGSGAGFPGVPLKILRPDINLTLIDSLAKRIKFLQTVKNNLGLENLNCIHARAEEFVKTDDNRENYDLCVSRAVANLSILCEICLPFVKIGGYFVAYKGSEIKSEIKIAKSAIDKLGASISDIKKITLPYSNITHSLIFVRKLSHTPLKYPRVYAKISKRPL
jgi:16S rRNA (guanine(527)-N(7))-methyltransferase GidB